MSDAPPPADREEHFADEAHDEYMAARHLVRTGTPITEIADDLTLLTEADLREGFAGEGELLLDAVDYRDQYIAFLEEQLVSAEKALIREFDSDFQEKVAELEEAVEEDRVAEYFRWEGPDE